MPRLYVKRTQRVQDGDKVPHQKADEPDGLFSISNVPAKVITYLRNSSLLDEDGKLPKTRDFVIQRKSSMFNG
jgi:hypothetical protein